MLRIIFFSAFLTSYLLSTASYAMEDVDPRAMQNIRIEKKAELDQFIKEYRETGKPISLAVACGSKEMPDKIKKDFGSPIPAVENWIGLDLYITDQHSWGGPHIRMDANNAVHWQQVADYLKDNSVQVQTVALTISLPAFPSSIFQESILPLVKKGGMVVYPECFRISEAGCFHDIHNRLYSLKYGEKFDTGLWNYYNPQGTCYQNPEALFQETMGWIEKSRSSMGSNVGAYFPCHINPIDAEKKLEAKVFVSRIMSVKPEFLDNGKWLHSEQVVDGQWVYNNISKKMEELGIKVDWFFPIPVFTKTEEEFAEEYFGLFKDYMNELGFDPSSYKIYSSQMPLLKGVEWYEYPKDGTLKLTYYGGLPSLVFTKK